MLGIKYLKKIMSGINGFKAEINPNEISHVFELVHIMGCQPFIARKSKDSGIFIDNYSIKNNGDEIEFNFSINIKNGYFKLNPLVELSKTDDLKRKQSPKGGGVRKRGPEVPIPSPPQPPKS